MLPATRQQILQHTPAAEIWGIGRKLATRLATQGILTAWDLARMPASQARRTGSVVLERKVYELQGTSCISLEQAPRPKQQIACTRSFGHAVTTLPPLIEAISEFATRAAEKLRQSGQSAGAVQVFAHTSPFRPGPRFYQSTIVPLQPPSSDTTVLVNAAVAGVRAIYQPGYPLAKAGVLLLDLGRAAAEQRMLDWDDAPRSTRDPGPLMQALDRINQRWGKSTVHVASSGHAETTPSAWRMKQECRTPRYTTVLGEVPVARA